ncbi:MAG: ribonuclease H-like domain-containing protein [Holosporaceae bacterium]|jgi:ribonuclease D|nr:ribonuclease H-like domain-containing protein [Holosporaceae bacterium]
MNLYKNDLPSEVKFSSSVAIDTEAMGLILRRDRLCLVQLCSAEGDVHMVQMENDQEHRAINLKKLLTDESVLKIFHFARFDVGLLNYSLGIRVNNIYCTKIASKLARTYSDKHGLKNICKELLNIDISKHEQSSDWGSQELSAEQLSYAQSDVLHLHALKNKLDEILIREGRFELAQKCFRTIDLISELDLLSISPEELFQH